MLGQLVDSPTNVLFQSALSIAVLNGAGLGLSLVAEFVRLHCGTVDIQSQLGEGTVVRIVLPNLDAGGRWAIAKHRS